MQTTESIRELARVKKHIGRRQAAARSRELEQITKFTELERHEQAVAVFGCEEELAESGAPW
jgi:hypothetical protein